MIHVARVAYSPGLESGWCAWFERPDGNRTGYVFGHNADATCRRAWREWGGDTPVLIHVRGPE